MNDEANNLEQRITFDSISLLYNSMVNKCFGSVVFILILLAIMWDDERIIISMCWGLLMLLGVVAQEMLVRAFVAAGVQLNQIEVWKKRLLFSYLWFGLLWASTIIIFYTDNSVEHQIFLITMLTSVSIGGIFSRMHYLELYYVYSLPIYAAMILRFFMEGTFTYTVLAVLLSWGFLFSLRISKQMNSTMRTTMRLRYESTILSEQLKIKSDEAHQSSQAKSRFLASASHDLRQPLHSLSLFIDVLKNTKSDSERENLLPRIQLSLDALIKLFDALLDLSHLDDKALEVNVYHFDIAKLLEELVHDFSEEAEGNGITLKSHAQSLIVISDAILIERVLRNLISNALRYTKNGGVLLSARKRDDNVLLQVWDTGIGIPKENKEDVFAEFKQLDNPQRDRRNGIGLGLYIVQRICQILKHPLSLNTQLGRGSVFSVMLPRGTKILTADKISISNILNWNFEGRRILVVDDEVEILHATKLLLEKWGCDVEVAESYEDAVHLLTDKQKVPELILSDLRQRDNVSGVHVLDSLREIYGRSIKGILITGDTVPKRLQEAKESGYEILQKPMKPAQLRVVLQYHLLEVTD